MDKKEFQYKIMRNKNKIMLFLGLLMLLGVLILGLFIFKNKFTYESFDENDSVKYVLASNIIGANNDGTINLYDIKKGTLLDSLSLEGNYLIDMSDDLKSLYMLNIDGFNLYTITCKDNKLVHEEISLNLSKSSNFSAFDYDNGNIVILRDDQKSFLIKDKDSDEFKLFKPDVNENIDLFRIVKENLIFTSGDYIYSKSIAVDLNNIDNIKITQVPLKLRDKENIYGNILADIPAGEKLKIIGEGDTGWYHILYNGIEGYVSNSSSKFKEVSASDGGLVKIEIGEKSNFIHEINDILFIHNNFGEDRGKSILLELNPDSLYIKNLVEYEGITNTLISNNSDSRIYINEILSDKNLQINQAVKFRNIDDTQNRLAFKHVSDTILTNYNSYGTLGYIYYRDKQGVNIYNIKSQEKDLTISINDEFFMPIY